MIHFAERSLHKVNILAKGHASAHRGALYTEYVVHLRSVQRIRKIPRWQSP